MARVGRLGPLFRTAGHRVRTQHGVSTSAENRQKRGDVEILNYLQDAAGSRKPGLVCGRSALNAIGRLCPKRPKKPAPAAGLTCFCFCGRGDERVPERIWAVYG